MAGSILAVSSPDAELRSGAVDISAAGAILVAGARLDIEALTRARAIGVAGIICGGVVGRELQQVEESDQRQRASVHALTPFAILALDGFGRRPIPTLAWDLLAAAAADERLVGILPDARLAVVGGEPSTLPVSDWPADAVRVAAGDGAGRTGRLVGLAGPVRRPGGIYQSAGYVAFGATRRRRRGTATGGPRRSGAAWRELVTMMATARPVMPVVAGFQVRTTSAAATRSLASWLADVAAPGDRIALLGPLGAGKTQFAKGFAAGLGVPDTVTSPSFTLMAEYQGRLPLYHQDLYRLAGAVEALEGGLLDERQDTGVTLSEWADRLDASVDTDRLEVRFVLDEDEATREDAGTEGQRVLRFSGTPAYGRYLERALAWRPEEP